MDRAQRLNAVADHVERLQIDGRAFADLLRALLFDSPVEPDGLTLAEVQALRSGALVISPDELASALRACAAAVGTQPSEASDSP